jgi:hypothetical protein
MIKTEVLKAIANWRKVAINYKIASSEIERKANAFKAGTTTSGRG